MGIVTVHGLGLEGAYHSECKGHLIAEKTPNLYDNSTTRPFYQLFRAESATPPLRPHPSDKTQQILTNNQNTQLNLALINTKSLA
ncbi:hypothetical protein [Pseudomonas synxantha]|uniref:hypothetical protein n=1 Tax=Pseudomonas synxantha TaxID=47883 RepID=UPI00278EF859|nr:hypothetical protein [Pseudomonas synxantha]MDQ0982145.1 hypothetical protein [Pseudomonas synxantha]